jgi:hypothetical protein
VTWLKGLSGCFSNSFLISTIFWFLRRPFSSFISSSLRSSYWAYAALNRRSGCRSSLSFESAVKSRASRALSIPVALRALGFSNEPRAESMPRAVFFSALGALPLGFEGKEASSSAKRASFSAFLRAASAAFAAAASLHCSQFLCPQSLQHARTPLNLTLRPCSTHLLRLPLLACPSQLAWTRRHRPCAPDPAPSWTPHHLQQPRLSLPCLLLVSSMCRCCREEVVAVVDSCAWEMTRELKFGRLRRRRRRCLSRKTGGGAMRHRSDTRE